MKLRWLVIVVAGFGIVAADPALARARHKGTPHCAPLPLKFSWEKLLFGGPPEPNGCAPPVYQYGRYIGQDPDPNIRFQLLRDPNTGFTPFN